MGHFVAFTNNVEINNEIYIYLPVWLIQSIIAMTITHLYLQIANINNFLIIFLTNFIYFWALPKLFEINVLTDVSAIIFFPISSILLKNFDFYIILLLLTPILDEILLGVPLSFLVHKLLQIINNKGNTLDV